jgi:iron complex outermembrane receptor protein
MKFPKLFSRSLAGVVVWTMLAAIPALFAQDPEQEEKDKKARVRTEEIVVTAPAPQDKPLASTALIPASILIPLAPRSLADVLSYAPGAYATSGGKGESHVKIRGLDTDKSTLLLDGIPVYDPYFNSYDLKTVLTEDVEAVKVVKGASSVLYGANTLGGIVDVLTLKPKTPSLTLRAAAGRDSSYILSASGAVAWRKTVFMGAVARDHSNGLRIPMGDSTASLNNSDYGKTALTGRSISSREKSEIPAQASAIPPNGDRRRHAILQVRYWRFMTGGA